MRVWHSKWLSITTEIQSCLGLTLADGPTRENPLLRLSSTPGSGSTIHDNWPQAPDSVTAYVVK